jgi:tetratricopeptide (TPR) repeat protein
VAIWEDSVRGNPQNFRAWVQLGTAYVVAKRCSEAINAFQHAEKLGHLEQGLYLDYAAAFECYKQIDRAAAAYRRAIAILPEARKWTLLAALFERQGRWDEAFDALDQAERLDPAYWEVYSFRGSAYLELARFEEAASEYRHALALRPNDEFSLIGLWKADTAIRNMRGKGLSPSK